jgi:hypothetical protein
MTDKDPPTPASVQYSAPVQATMDGLRNLFAGALAGMGTDLETLFQTNASSKPSPFANTARELAIGFAKLLEAQARGAVTPSGSPPPPPPPPPPET